MIDFELTRTILQDVPILRFLHLTDADTSTADNLVGAGDTMTVDASRTSPGHHIWFDATAETDGNYVFFGGASDDIFLGGAGDDEIYLGDTDTLWGADSVSGGAGDDIVQTGAFDPAFDSLVGGAGNDRLIISASAQPGAAGLVVPLSLANVSEFETIQLGAHSGTLLNYAIVAPDSLVGSGQIVRIDASRMGAPSLVIFDGQLETDGAYVFVGSGGRNVFTGGAGADNLSGAGGVDQLVGGGGADVLNGGVGADILVGGDGNDTYVVDAADDVTTEASAVGGTDRVLSSVTRTLGANLESLTLTGALAINGTGNTLANILIGNNGANTLSGGTGGDTLNGGLGLDRLTGGNGNDKFVFNTAPASANRDTISDYNVAADTIHLEKDVFAGLGALGVLVAGKFHIGAAAHDASDRIIYDSASGRLYFDADGNGAGAKIWFATLDAGLALTAADFVVI